MVSGLTAFQRMNAAPKQGRGLILRPANVLQDDQGASAELRLRRFQNAAERPCSATSIVSTVSWSPAKRDSHNARKSPARRSN